MWETDRRTLPGRLSCLRNPAIHGADHMAVVRQTEIAKGLTGHVTDNSLGGEVCGRHGQQRLPPDGMQHCKALVGQLHASLEGPRVNRTSSSSAHPIPSPPVRQTLESSWPHHTNAVARGIPADERMVEGLGSLLAMKGCRLPFATSAVINR